MRWRVFGAVVFAFACSYAILWSFGYARARLVEAVQEIAEHIEVGRQPRFEVKRATVTLPAGEEKRLRIENTAGEVEVLPGGPDTVAEYVIYARGEDEEHARRRAEVLEVRGDPATKWGDRIWVAKEEGERWPPGVSVRLVVKTPPDRELSVKVVSADVGVQGMEGSVAVDAVSGDISVGDGAASVTAHAVSGDIHVDDAGGPVAARTTSGDIRVADTAGPVAAHSVSGDIRVDDRDGFVEAKTTSGDVRITAVAGEHIEVSSVSGDIAIEFTPPFSGDLKSRSISGNVGLALPASSDCTVRATTVSGSISGKAWSEISRREGRARLGSGAGSAELSTTSGNIRLETSG
jgi:DUF4097 and DUF4098 domain-containing protein YvlB